MSYSSPNRRGVTPQHKGSYPEFDVLRQADRWDDETAGVVLARLAPPNSLGFLTMEERAIAQPLLDLLLAQDQEPRIPVLPLIDTRLAIGETDGRHYDDMPQDSQTWRNTLAFLDEDAQQACGEGFASIDARRQARLIQRVQDLTDESGRWHRYPASQVWSLWTRYACTAFYSHPWAWNEIGFPGPAYPRGYLNPGINARERWETAAQQDVDPIPFVQRTERARRLHAELTGSTGQPEAGRHP